VRSDQSPEVRAAIAKAFAAVLKERADALRDDGVPWRWAKGWALMLVSPASKKIDGRARAAFFDALEHVARAIHRVAPLAEVVFGGRIEGWPSPRHPWDDWSVEAGRAPGAPVFAHYQRLGFPGRSNAKARDTNDPVFDAALADARGQRGKSKTSGTRGDLGTATEQVTNAGLAWHAESGRWWTAKVTPLGDGRARVHYVGWDASWDETVPMTKVKAMPPPATDLAAGQGVMVEYEGAGWYEARLVKPSAKKSWVVRYDQDTSTETVAASTIRRRTDFSPPPAVKGRGR